MTALSGAQASGDLFDLDSDDDPPVDIQEMLQLQNLGVAANHVTWTRVTMTSSSHICLKQRTDHRQQTEQALVLELENDKCETIALPPQSEHCMVNPTTDKSMSPLLAVKVGLCLRIYSLSGGPVHEVCQCDVPATTEFWTWLDHRTVGIVTETAVFTWTPDTKGDSKLVEVFPRCSRLNNAEIIALKASHDQQWFALVGLIPQTDEIVGLTQLYSQADQVTQAICAHAVAFSQYTFSDNQQASTVLCVAVRDAPLTSAAKFHVVELGTSGQGTTHSFIESLPFPVDELHYDFPIAIQVWSSAGLALVLSKYGRVFVSDLETGTCLCTTPVAEDVVFTSALYHEGLLAISVNGKVMRVLIRCDELVHHCKHVLNNPHISERLHQAFSTLDRHGNHDPPPAGTRHRMDVGEGTSATQSSQPMATETKE